MTVLGISWTESAGEPPASLLLSHTLGTFTYVRSDIASARALQAHKDAYRLAEERAEERAGS